MNKLMKALIPAATLLVSGQVLAEGTYYLTPTVEKGLQKVCKTAAKDQLHQMHSTMKENDWSFRLMSLNVMCNGQDLISFAEGYGAENTTARLIRSLGTISVTDIAAVNQHKYDVTVDMN